MLEVFLIGGIYWLPESPEFLFAKGKFEESEQVIIRIAAINGVHIPPNTLNFKKIDELSQHDTNEENRYLTSNDQEANE